MRVLVTGSAGHLGEALVRQLRARGDSVIGLDVLRSEYTDVVGSICDRTVVGDAVAHVDGVIHAATLHKPHIGSHSTQDFIDVNISGTANLVEAAAAAGVQSFVFCSTTSAFGRALSPPRDQPAAWITEETAPATKNIYGASKLAAEDLCQLTCQNRELPVVALRLSRFFPEDDDAESVRDEFASENAKVNELLFRRVDLADAVTACVAGLERAPAVGYARYVISATTPFAPDDLAQLRADAAGVVARYFPAYEDLFEGRGWRMFTAIDRVYVNAKAREELGWEPRHDFAWALDRLAGGEPTTSDLARTVGKKGYHPEPTGVYTTERR